MGKYVLIYVLFQGMKKEESYVSYMVNALSPYYDELVYVTCGEEEDIEKVVREKWRQVSPEVYRGLICVTSRLLGPFWDIGKEVDDFEKKKEDGMAYYDPIDTIPDFFILKKELCSRKWTWKQIKAKWSIYEQKGGYPIREDRFRPNTLIQSGCPFMNMDCFGISDDPRYTMGEETSRAFSWIERETCYDTDMIWDIILKRYNICDIKQALHLNYTIHRGGCVAKKTEKVKAAVFLHLFYEDMLEELLSYITRLPAYIDIYISTDPIRVIALKKLLDQKKVNVVAVIGAGERGRDAGALLVAFQPYVKKYEYICFLHDKKTSGGLEPDSVGHSFQNLIWDSLLKNSHQVESILSLFEENKRLGFLSPPIPLVGMYLKNLLGIEWTICYDETKRLAEQLGIHIRIDRNKPVFALSTSFWCRTEALMPLFTYPWKYEDFPEEPLRLDGTINHAIERILIYIAQERGYYSAIVTTEEYTSCYVERQMLLLDDIFGKLHQIWPGLRIPLDLNSMIYELCHLLIFCKTHRRLLVYGSGAQAEYLFDRLDDLGIKVHLVIVTKKGDNEWFRGHPVKEFREVERTLDSTCGIILAMSRKYQEEVIKDVEDTGIDYFQISAEE